MHIVSDISWSKSILYSFVPGVVSFIFFLLLEIIWGDILNSTLEAQYQVAQYANVTLVLWVGLLFVIATSITVNVTLYKDYRFGPRIMSNVFATIGMLIALFAISWLTIVIQYKEMYLQMTVVEELYFLPLAYSFFAVYILPNPVYFWVLAFIIYHIFLAIFTKLLFIQK
jgi:hypothetical protein